MSGLIHATSLFVQMAGITYGVAAAIAMGFGLKATPVELALCALIYDTIAIECYAGCLRFSDKYERSTPDE